MPVASSENGLEGGRHKVASQRVGKHPANERFNVYGEVRAVADSTTRECPTDGHFNVNGHQWYFPERATFTALAFGDEV